MTPSWLPEEVQAARLMAGEPVKTVGGGCLGGLIGAFLGVLIGGLIGSVYYGKPHPTIEVRGEARDWREGARELEVGLALGALDVCGGFFMMVLGAGIGGIIGGVGGSVLGAGNGRESFEDAHGRTSFRDGLQISQWVRPTNRVARRRVGTLEETAH